MNNQKSVPSKTWFQTIASFLEKYSGKQFQIVLDSSGFTDNAYFNDLGWVFIEAGNPLELRYHYENLIRKQNTPDEKIFIKVAFKLKQIPYDISDQLKLLDLSPEMLFPTLNSNLLKELPSDWYQELFDIQDRSKGKKLSSQQTAFHILRICLGMELQSKIRRTHIFHIIANLVLQDIRFPSHLAQFIVSDTTPQEILNALTDLQTARDLLDEIWKGYSKTLISSRKIAETNQPTYLQNLISTFEADTRLHDDFSKLCTKGNVPVMQISPDHLPLPEWLQEGIHYSIDMKREFFVSFKMLYVLHAPSREIIYNSNCVSFEQKLGHNN